jgi:hypothetical protein
MEAIYVNIEEVCQPTIVGHSLIMYVVIIIDHIHHLINESKMLIFTYNSDRRVYCF